MRPVSNGCSREPDELPDHEVNAPPGFDRRTMLRGIWDEKRSCRGWGESPASRRPATRDRAAFPWGWPLRSEAGLPGTSFVDHASPPGDPDPGSGIGERRGGEL